MYRSLPRSECCYGSALQARFLLLLLLHRRSPRSRCLYAPPVRSPSAAVDVCWSAWLWSANSAGAGRKFAASRVRGAPWPCCRSGSRSCCDAAGRARCAAGAAPSPRCVVTPHNLPSRSPSATETYSEIIIPPQTSIALISAACFFSICPLPFHLYLFIFFFYKTDSIASILVNICQLVL